MAAAVAGAGVFYSAQLVLRVFVIAFTLAAAIIMLNSHTPGPWGTPIEARYSDSPSLKFNLVADYVVCGLTVLSLVFLICLPKSNPNINYFYLLINDLISLVVLLSGCTAAMAIGYVGKFGYTSTAAYWFPICDILPKFCDKTTASVATSFFALLCCLLLTLMSANNLKLNSIATI